MVYEFNVLFTRRDENHATAHTVGYRVTESSRDRAELRARQQLAHVTIAGVTLARFIDADGDVVTVCPTCDGYKTVEVCWNNNPNRCETIACDACDGTGAVR